MSIGKHGQLIYEEYDWECWEFKCYASIHRANDYDTVKSYIQDHYNDSGHHQGRLTITKVVETWK